MLVIIQITCLLCIPDVVTLVKYDVPLLITGLSILYNFRDVKNDTKIDVSLFDLSRGEAQFKQKTETKLQCITMVLNYMFSSVAQSCPTLYDPMDCSMPGLPVHH